jgi:hypothetical protein
MMIKKILKNHFMKFFYLYFKSIVFPSNKLFFDIIQYIIKKKTINRFSFASFRI